MATIAQIQTDLLNATKTGNATLLASTLASITTTQLAQVGATTLTQSLGNLTAVASATTAASMTQSLMAKLGAYVPASSIGTAMASFAAKKNFAAIDAVTDYLTAAQKSALPPADVRTTLNRITESDNPGVTTDDTAVANATRDLMTKLGTHIDAATLIRSAEIFSIIKNYAALDALTDNLVAANRTYANGNSMAIGNLDNIALTIAYNDHPDTTADNATHANAMRDFMTKLGTYVSASAFVEAAEIFALTKNYLALDAMLDTMTANNKKYANGNNLALGGVDEIILSIAYNDDPGTTTDNAATATIMRDFMTKLGSLVSASAFVEVAEIMVLGQNYAALDALMDTISANNKIYANGYNLALGGVDNIVLRLAYNDNPASSADNNVIADAVRGFMTKLGPYVSASALLESAEIFVLGQNYGALDALTDKLASSNTLYANGNNMAIGSVDSIVLGIAYNDDPGTTADNTTITNVLRDFMGKLGAYTSNAALNEATEILALNKNIAGLDALLGEATSSQLTGLSASAKSEIAAAGVKLLTGGADTFNGTAAAEKIFGGAGSDTLYGKDGNDALYGDAGNDWLYGDNGNDILSGGAGNDVLVGGAGNDSLRGGTGTNDMTGGTGADTFVFDATVLGKSTNRIADFNRTQGDKIDISDVLEIADPTTATLSQFVKLTAGADGVHTLSVDVNGTEGGANFVALATIVGVANGTTAEQLLTAGNLVV